MQASPELVFEKSINNSCIPQKFQRGLHHFSIKGWLHVHILPQNNTRILQRFVRENLMCFLILRYDIVKSNTDLNRNSLTSHIWYLGYSHIDMHVKFLIRMRCYLNLSSDLNFLLSLFVSN